MSKRPLRLDSPDWMPLDVLHPLICEKTGDRRLADRDLTDAMANGRVRSMRRRISPPEREQLLPSFWAETTNWIAPGPTSPLGAASWRRQSWTARCAFEIVPLRGGMTLRGYVFYAWKPDCKKIFGLGVAVEDTKEPVHEKLEKSGRPQTIRRQELREEIVRRCWQKGRFIAPESHTILITELRAWHKRKFKNEPNYDDLRKFVGDAIAILKLTGK